MTAISTFGTKLESSGASTVTKAQYLHSIAMLSLDLLFRAALKVLSHFGDF